MTRRDVGLGARTERDLLTLCAGVALAFAAGHRLGGDGLACGLAGIVLLVMAARVA